MSFISSSSTIVFEFSSFASEISVDSSSNGLTPKILTKSSLKITSFSNKSSAKQLTFLYYYQGYRWLFDTAILSF
jgi:hypothetical protein